MQKILYFLFLCCVAHLLGAQKVWYVNASAAGQNTGADWANAFTDLQSAVHLAQKGDAVWVAGGTYLPTDGSDRNASFEQKSGVKLSGGFEGFETSPAQRQAIAPASILSGDIGAPGDSTDNSYTILYLSYPDSATLIDGFTFRHGFASSDTSFNYGSRVLCGAAVYVEAQNGIGLPVFEHCRFLDNFAQGSGGAYFVSAAGTSGSTPVFRYCEFRNNWAWQKGGAIYLAGGNAYDRGVEFDHCILSNNKAWSQQAQGGALYFQQDYGKEEIEFLGCTFDHNYSVHHGGALSVWYVNPDQVIWKLDSCNIVNNYSNTGSGVSWFSFSFSSNVPVVKFILANSFISNNSAYKPHAPLLAFDAATSNGDGFVEITNNTFYKNANGTLISTATKTVSNKFIENENFELVYGSYSANNLFLKNKRACLVNSNSYRYKDAIVNNIFIQNGPSQISDNEAFFPVSARNGQGKLKIFGNLFYENTCQYSTNSPPIPVTPTYDFRNNIIRNNRNLATGQIVLPFPLTTDSCVLTHNLLDIDCASLPPVAYCAEGNIFSSNPMFADTAGGDFRLMPCSPGINAGSNDSLQVIGVDTDVDGGPRILDGVVDIGPYESPMLETAQTPKITPACAGLPNGAVQFDLLNACEPLSVHWNQGAQSGANTDQLAPGVYEFSLTDQKGKVLTISVQVPGSPPLLADAVVLDASGPAKADGMITFQPQGGSVPYTYLWNTGSDQSVLMNLLPGIYSLTVTDALGCVYTFEYEVKYILDTGAPIPSLATVQPNPARDEVQVWFGRFSRWRLFSSDGRLHRTLTGIPSAKNPDSTSIRDLPGGAYYYLFDNEQGRSSAGRLIIVH